MSAADDHREDTTARLGASKKRPLSRPSLRIVEAAKENMETAKGDFPSTAVAADLAINTAMDEVLRLRCARSEIEIENLRAQLKRTNTALFVAKEDARRLRRRLQDVER